MVHRATAGNSSFRGYSAGGTRSAISGADDTTQMQEFAGNFMSGEARKAMETIQNFGHTSVVLDAIKDKLGKMVGSAETMISFMGGNRSFPVGGSTDDRRHRLNGLEKGESGLFGTQGMKQQLHVSTDGMFSSVPQDKTMRMALLDEDSEKDGDSQSFQQQQSSGGGSAAAAVSGRDFLETDKDGVTHFMHIDKHGLLHKFRSIFPLGISNYSHVVALADSGGGAGGSGGAGGGSGMKMGQKSLKDKNQKAGRFIDITKDKSRMAGKIVQLIMASSSGGGSSGGSSGRAGSSGGGSSGGGSSSSQDSGTVLAEASSDSKFYCGGTPKKGKYALIVTVKGPTINVPGRIG